ncbi:MAG: cell division protein SepF [Candidatus Parvarchaeota archaeon]|nr:cell division protein SepF [Candidatus Parvarchaeota archaeon]MCW1295478.1 cell division protein SepF [Candidatus Parvarchaeum tengchongense]MCW1299464.1 cell division protein SepF [Candidatus Parvarchaeum tengchongense]MCW1312585.1 cell division protein SepF [Candidatus Parvarchaeum tengchongense]
MVNLPFDNFLNIFKKNVNVDSSSQGSDYVELEVEQGDKPMAKIYVKYYNLNKFEDASAILNDIRSGYTLSFIKVKEIREKGGVDELKRTISKLKKSADAAEAQIIGVDEDYLLVVPDFVKVEKGEVLSGQDNKV